MFSAASPLPGDHADEQHGWKTCTAGCGAQSFDWKGLGKGMVFKGRELYSDSQKTNAFARKVLDAIGGKGGGKDCLCQNMFHHVSSTVFIHNFELKTSDVSP